MCIVINKRKLNLSFISFIRNLYFSPIILSEIFRPFQFCILAISNFLQNGSYLSSYSKQKIVTYLVDKPYLLSFYGRVLRFCTLLNIGVIGPNASATFLVFSASQEFQSSNITMQAIAKMKKH